ncbi:hypothetical protein [Neorhodopirellula pilleata]|uniref:Uncharacterized protein n=1 Tax=Neorhodopirellula pilleata TaxID=2714738 RepID=A0A5C5ZLF3_9BACT|nr:hypothetical protein [Neorhodopirellula pilleata]TWT87995.1 hypothetical protein Pla100_57250 [Neorhodopirellula pilleata]
MGFRCIDEKQAAKSHEQNSGRPPKDKPVENLPQVMGKARDAAGKASGVSGKSVDHAKRVIEKGLRMREKFTPKPAHYSHTLRLRPRTPAAPHAIEATASGAAGVIGA